MVRYKPEEAELLKKVVEKSTNENKAHATDRISEELKARRKFEARRDAVYNYFFELTGQPMSNEQFNKYNDLFNKAKPGYNLWQFILDEKIVVDERIKSMGYTEFIENELGIKPEDTEQKNENIQKA